MASSIWVSRLSVRRPIPEKGCKGPPPVLAAPPRARDVGAVTQTKDRAMRPIQPRSVGLLVLAAALSLPLPAAAQNMADHQYSTADIEAGARVYVADCALCHGANGDGVDGVDLRRGRFRTARSDEDIRRVVTTGVAGSRMPSFDLGEAQLNGVVAYIRAGFDPSGIAVKVGDPARGQAIFESVGRCAGCHQV